ncbi:MAG: tetratricopeptide repeat protein [Pyrinomonadaceae bacterium]|nr:tetratricopeptide repeat protein [Pyrinomonadaceae bacterium]
MHNEINIDGFLNNTFQNIENSNIEVTQILVKSFEYNDLLDKIRTRQKLFDRTPENETEERLQLSAEINQLKKTFKQFKRDVTALAETFNKLEINTDRLRRAKEYFDKGEIGEARAVLKTELEQMQDEQTHLLKQREQYETEVLPNLINNSEEFYLLAMATQADYENPNRFEDTCRYFEDSIKSHPTKFNVFNYAKFLQEHNFFDKASEFYSTFLKSFSNEIQEDEYAVTLNNLAVLHRNQNRYDEALREYEESLAIRQKLAETNPQTFLPFVATTLNNLAILHSDQNRYEEALTEYEEALTIYRKLAETNPQTFLPFVATTLNNLAVLHRNQNRYDEALTEYEEALTIYRKLAETNPQTFLPDVAMTLNNLALLHSNQNRYDEALTEYEEALTIRRKLAETNPQTFLPDVAMTLNNLAILHSDQNRYDEALTEYEEALAIRRKLAETNPQTFLPFVATTLNNLAVLHADQNRYDEALTEYEEALAIRRKLAETNPQTFLPFVATTLNNLAIWFAEQKEFDKASAKFEESTNIYRELAINNFQSYFPFLARNLKNLALFYQDFIPEREVSIEYAIQVIIILLPYVENVPFTQEYFQGALNVLRNWNLSNEEISQMIAERMEGNE